MAAEIYTFIRDAFGSNLTFDTGHPDCGFSWISSVPEGVY
jgi:hypothetical protein